MARKRRSFGRIEKLPSGRYRARYIGPDMCVHKAPVTFQAKIDAERWLGNEDRLIGRDEWTPPAEREARDEAAPMTVGEWLDKVIDQRAARTRRPLRPSTVDLYRKLVRIPLAGLSPVLLRALTPAKVREWHDSLPSDNPTQNAAAYSLLKSALADAVDEGLIAANPCRIKGAGGKPRPVHEGEALTVTEVVAYLEAVPEAYRLPLAFAGWCGLRSGEVRALRRRDVDLARGVVEIRQTVTRVKDANGKMTWHIGPPKTAAGVRTAAIPPHMLPAVAQWLKDAPVTGRDGLLFPAGDKRSPLNSSVLGEAHAKGRASIGRPTLRVHDLRRTAATIAAQEGATTAEVMRLLGHTTVDVAMLYQVASEKRDAERAERLSEAVRKLEG